MIWLKWPDPPLEMGRLHRPPLSTHTSIRILTWQCVSRSLGSLFWAHHEDRDIIFTKEDNVIGQKERVGQQKEDAGQPEDLVSAWFSSFRNWTESTFYSQAYAQWKWKSLSVQLFATTIHGILQARTLEWVAFPFTRGSSQPGMEPRSPALQADSLPAEPQRKPICSDKV